MIGSIRRGGPWVLAATLVAGARGGEMVGPPGPERRVAARDQGWSNDGLELTARGIEAPPGAPAGTYVELTLHNRGPRRACLGSTTAWTARYEVEVIRHPPGGGPTTSAGRAAMGVVSEGSSITWYVEPGASEPRRFRLGGEFDLSGPGRYELRAAFLAPRAMAGPGTAEDWAATMDGRLTYPADRPIWSEATQLAR